MSGDMTAQAARADGGSGTQTALLDNDEWEQRKRSDALLSPDGRYRYWLTREWGIGLRCCWVMLNPSTADASEDDPTIRRCIAFSKAWGFGRMVVVNLWAARATNPKDLLTLGDPIGPDNGEAISLAINGSAGVVLAWGAFAGRMKAAKRLRLHPEEDAKRAEVPVWALGYTKDGHPRHPLYVRGGVEPYPHWWPPRGGYDVRDFGGPI